MSSQTSRRPSGLATINADRFDASAAVGGPRGIAEAVVPTLVFVVVLVFAPHALAVAVGASLAVSAVALVVRLLQRQSAAQVLSGALVAVVSAVMAWHSGNASDFYLTGLAINTAWLAVCLVSVLVRRPLVGVLMELRHSVGSGSDAAPRGSWRTDPARAGSRRRYLAGTWVLAAMFALRLAVEVPLYLAGGEAVAALGVARIVLGVPLYVLCLWFVWLVVRPEVVRRPAASADAGGTEGARTSAGAGD